MISNTDIKTLAESIDSLKQELKEVKIELNAVSEVLADYFKAFFVDNKNKTFIVDALKEAFSL